jgi:2-dehydropantoate 2-reductase
MLRPIKISLPSVPYILLLTYNPNWKSVNGDIHIPPEKLQAFASTKDIGPVDWVIVALKSSSLEAIPELVYPLLHQDTRIVVIMNGLIEEDLLVMLSEKAGENPPLDSNISYCAAVYGGMALICSNRVAPGHIDHSYAGLLTGGLAAASNSDEGKNEEAFKQLWEPTEVDIAYDVSLLRGRWKKNLWNLPFNGISVAMGGITIDLIVNDPGLRQLAYAVMDETIAIANAELSYHGYDESWHLGEAEKKAMMELSDGMGPYKTSTMLDLVQGCRMEVRYLFREALNRANRLGIPAAHLETLVIMIEAIQKNRGL